jgi:hypothetical protein
MANGAAKRWIIWGAALWTTAMVLLPSLLFLSLSPKLPFMQWRWRLAWLLGSGKYKAAVRAQPQEPGEGLQHIEWEEWGWGEQGNTTVYLAFDPNNALAQAARTGLPGRYPGIRCEVPSVRRLASQWYTVEFYTNIDWDHCD